MPKRPTRAAASNPDSRQKKQTSSPASGFFSETKAVLQSERFRIAVGFVIVLFTLYAFVTYISYFIHGADDLSALGSELSGRELREAIGNTGGVLGARMQQFFIDRCFGIPSVALIVLLLLVGLKLMKADLKLWKAALHCFFWLVWGSLMFAFVQIELGFDASSFFRWGGSHGEYFTMLLINNIQWVGMLLVLLSVILVYFIGISRNTIPALVRMGEWIKGIFRKKVKVDNNDSDNDSDNESDADVAKAEDETTVIDLTDEFEETAKEPAEETTEEPPFVIEGLEIVQEQHEDSDPIESQEPLQQPNQEESLEPQEPQEQPKPFSIEKVKDVDMVNKDPETLLEELGPYDPRKDLEHYQFPSLDLLKVYDNESAPVIDQEEQRTNANRIVTTLRNYGVEIESIKATVGPTVTLYEVVPKAGVRISKIQGLEQDIMLALSAVGIRIIAPMPGKGTVGIEIPNEKPQTVSMHSVIASKRFQEEKKMRLPIALGRTITNEIFMFDLAKTPHLLVAGATGQGKSVAINAIITSLLYKKHPAEMKMVLVDPKMVEFAPYKPLLRHYLAAMPDTEENEVIITDCSKVVDTLNSLVIEMENRYKLLMDAGVRNLEDYNDKFVNRRLNPEKLVEGSLHHQYLPYIVIVIDEYGDFIMQAGKQVETPIARITQKARAVGMHMILATQRPSVNIVTGVIKANIPTRIALRTQSVVDSRTVLDAKGADQLIGRGDLLYSGSGNITRVQCAFVDTPEVDAIVEHVQKQQHYSMPYELPEYVGNEGEGSNTAPGAVDLKKLDSMFAEVARYVVMNQQGSTSVLQRRFEIGYNRAGKLSDQLEAAGIVGPNKGSKGREVLIPDLMELEVKLKELGLA
ncbi:MAG: DNA translocase FtsK [Bacteroidales bacterium]|nr:DNA translocase FtsK [Bacteroidales bacterium]